MFDIFANVSSVYESFRLLQLFSSLSIFNKSMRKAHEITLFFIVRLLSLSVVFLPHYTLVFMTDNGIR